MFPASQPLNYVKGFQVLERLGSGGAGQVYLARSKGGRLVAIKVLSDAKDRDAAFDQTLVREASLCVRLNHPAIVQVRAFIEEEGLAAIVFDYVEGIALSRLFKFCSVLGVRLPDRVAWTIVLSVLEALAFAHAQTDEAHEPAPIVHRDVTPSNVLISWKGEVKLTDFGIAKMLGVSPATKVGLVKGTLGHMAPEQARGEAVDARADVYAAGLLAWRLATGRDPFAAYEQDDMELLRAMRAPRLKPLSALRPALPEPLLDAVGRALEPKPEDRTITTDELAKVVRAHFDPVAGQKELSALLGRWRSALEKRTPKSDESRPSLSSGDDEKQATSRYEDQPLTDFDEVDPDRPTAQFEALPGDEELWKALALQGPELNLPRVSMSDSEVAGPTGEALRIATKTPFAPIRDLPRFDSSDSSAAALAPTVPPGAKTEPPARMPPPSPEGAEPLGPAPRWWHAPLGLVLLAAAMTLVAWYLGARVPGLPSDGTSPAPPGRGQGLGR